MRFSNDEEQVETQVESNVEYENAQVWTYLPLGRVKPGLKGDHGLGVVDVFLHYVHFLYGRLV